MNKELYLFYVGHFLLHNDIIRSLIPEEIGEKPYGFDIDAIPQQVLAETFELTSMLLYLRALRKKNTTAMYTILEGFAEEISKRLRTMESLVNAALNDEELTKEKRTALLEISVQLSEGRLALDEGNYENFMTVFDRGLLAAGISPKQLDKDLEEVRGLAKKLKYALTTGLDDKTNAFTGVTQI
ncbi:MAG: hypothetical protein H7A37_01715 [Chlamydiales bacterium]|nr:hypothetical protein [Chlamydiia bacterium]MCP5507006.1 hypothetical protein [Chlamydiales bacterium]